MEIIEFKNIIVYNFYVIDKWEEEIMVDLQKKEKDLLATMKQLNEKDPKALQTFMNEQGLEENDNIAKESGVLGQDR